MHNIKIEVRKINATASVINQIQTGATAQDIMTGNEVLGWFSISNKGIRKRFILFYSGIEIKRCSFFNRYSVEMPRQVQYLSGNEVKVTLTYNVIVETDSGNITYNFGSPEEQNEFVSVLNTFMQIVKNKGQFFI